jgi:hypothetical protein
MFDMLILTMFRNRLVFILEHPVNCAYDPREGVLLSRFTDAKADEVYMA